MYELHMNRLEMTSKPTFISVLSQYSHLIRSSRQQATFVFKVCVEQWDRFLIPKQIVGVEARAAAIAIRRYSLRLDVDDLWYLDLQPSAIQIRRDATCGERIDRSERNEC
jgi:hypothetical protein